MIILFVLWKISVTEGRVYCQDINATPWMALGYPCPITCGTIITAVDRLKITDYQHLLNEKLRNRINISSSILYTIGQQLQENMIYGRKSNTLTPELKRHIKIFNTYNSLLSNERFPAALKNEIPRITYEFTNTTCGKIAQVEINKLYNMKLLRSNKCTRRLSKRPEVLEKFTKFLNKYADPRYPFDEEMSGIVLQKLEGTMNLRFGEVDFKRILSYLRKALRYHGSKTKGNQVVKLQPKNCISIYLPGCYCKVGFVENHGQCVKPQDCLGNSIFAEYLERIVLQ